MSADHIYIYTRFTTMHAESKGVEWWVMYWRVIQSDTDVFS